MDTTKSNWLRKEGRNYGLPSGENQDLSGGLPDRNRTCNPHLRRLVLYPVELRAAGFTPKKTITLRKLYERFLRKIGRGGEI